MTLLYKEFIETIFYIPANTSRQISFRLQRFVRCSSKPATVSLSENKIDYFLYTCRYTWEYV